MIRRSGRVKEFAEVVVECWSGEHIHLAGNVDHQYCVVGLVHSYRE